MARIAVLLLMTGLGCGGGADAERIADADPLPPRFDGVRSAIAYSTSAISLSWTPPGPSWDIR